MPRSTVILLCLIGLFLQCRACIAVTAGFLAISFMVGITLLARGVI